MTPSKFIGLLPRALKNEFEFYEDPKKKMPKRKKPVKHFLLPSSGVRVIRSLDWND